MEVKGKYRGFTVRITPSLADPYLIDERQRTLVIRRELLRPWRMLEALVKAMNDLAKRDDAWAANADARPMHLGTQRINLGGNMWQVKVCSVLLDKAGESDPMSMMPVDVDHDAREIRVCSRFNLGYGAFELVDAVASAFREGMLESLDDTAERLTGIGDDGEANLPAVDRSNELRTPIESAAA